MKKTTRRNVTKKNTTIENSMAEAILGSGFNIFQQFSQLSQSDTMFKNLRWNLVSNYRSLLSEVYVEVGLVQTVVDIPVDDGLRGGVEIRTKQLEENQIIELIATMERQNDLRELAQALKWNRLFGGSALIVLNGQDTHEELNMDQITEDTELEYHAVDMWELYYNYRAESSTIVFPWGEDYFNYYGKKVHTSRVMLFKGIEAPSFIRPRLRGWGFSIVESLVRGLNQYLKATNLAFEVLDEFKLDIFKIKGLTAGLIKAGATDRIQKRLQLAARQKNFQNALVMDGEDDYIQKQLSFAGIGEAMQGIRMQVASEMRIPLTKLFGISASGFNSGEDDIENYNAMIESQIRTPSKYQVLRMIEMRCKQKFGIIPDDLQVSFKPLRVLSSEQEENVKTQKFNRILSAKTAGEITSKEFREACNKDSLLPISLDLSVEDLGLPTPPTEQQEVEPDDNETSAYLNKR